MAAIMPGWSPATNAQKLNIIMQIHSHNTKTKDITASRIHAQVFHKTILLALLICSINEGLLSMNYEVNN